MKTFKAFFIVLIIVLFISPVKSQWIPCQGIEGASCQSITVQDSFLFIDGNGGIYRRLINDQAWDSACLIGGFMKIRSTGNTLFCFGGTTMTSLYRSIDNGFTWEYMADFDYEYRNIENVDSVIFLDTYNNGLLRSTDEGENWTAIDPSPVSAEINWIYSQQGILYSYLEDVDSLYMSMDYGDTWTVCPLTGISGEVGLAYLFEQNLWITKGNNFYIFDDISGTWNIQNDSLPSTVWMSYLIEDHESLCCYTNDGYYRFNHEDSVWEDESQGLENRFCWDACLLDSTIFMATSFGPFSKKGNENWVPQNNDLFGINVSKVFNQGSRIFALAKGRIFYSDDFTNGFEVLESHDYCPPNQMVTTDTAWYLGSNCGFSISVDSGQSWTAYNSGIEGRKVFNIAIGQNFFFAEVSQPSYPGLFRTRSDSIYWEIVPNEFGNAYFRDIEVINDVLFVIEGGGSNLYKSADNGTTFELIPEVGNANTSLIVKNNKIFLLRDYNDVLYSNDSGNSWDVWISGVYDKSILCLEITESDETTVLGGYQAPWNPMNYLVLFTQECPTGIDIVDNLPALNYSSVDDVLFSNGSIFACPSSGGLWYRDDLAVGIKDNKPSNAASYLQLSIYPNPAKDIIRIHQDKIIEMAEYQVIDYTGKIMMQGMLQDGLTTHSVNISGLPQGIYLIIIWDDNNLTSGKFIKTN